MDLVDAQPEFTLAFWDYLDRLVGEERIQRGREVLAENRAAFDAMEKNYGVDRYVIAAIWGIESKYSTMMGERSVVRSTATLACVGRRQDYFRNEFLAAIEILYRGDVQAERMKGSWAGAFGPTQFMPSVYKTYAVDADGDGRRDLTTSVPDLLFSTANYFKQATAGRPDRPGATRSRSRRISISLLADRNKLMSLREWEQLGIRRAGGKPFPRAADRAFLMVPAGSQGPGFLMLNNFRVIMRYNPAEAYALAIGHLSDRLRGGEPLVQSWPRHERVLTRDERTEMQQLLARRGFDIGDAGRPPGGQDARRDPGFPGAGRARSGRIPERHGARPVARQLSGKGARPTFARHLLLLCRSDPPRTEPGITVAVTQDHMARNDDTRRRWMLRALGLGGLALAAVVSGWPAQAQFFPFDDRFFGPPPRQQKPRPPVQQDQTTAPAPKKAEVPPNIRILVLGDSMADWLALGLEEQLAETPEIGILRKHRAFSGLIRYEQKSDAEWSKVARELIAAEKPQAIIVLLGLQDRHGDSREGAAEAAAAAAPASRHSRSPAQVAQPGIAAARRSLPTAMTTRPRRLRRRSRSACAPSVRPNFAARSGKSFTARKSTR